MKFLQVFLPVFILLILASCSNIPTMPSSIPSDPEGVSEPTTWGDDVDFTLSLDKSVDLVPIAVEDYVKIRLSFVSYDPPDISEENFKVFEDGRAQGFNLLKESEYRSKIDLVFLVDITGSMGEEIEGVKNSIANFLDYIRSSGFDVKVAIVPFDDNAPGGNFSPGWLDLSDPEDAENYVTQFYAFGGNDWPENSYGAMLFAWENVSWRSGSQRVMVLITDAQSHYEGETHAEPFDPQTTKTNLLGIFKGYCTVHVVVSTGGYYNEYDMDFSSPEDPRQIAIETGGLVIYHDPYEEVDLTSIGITDALVNTYMIVFQSDSPPGTHTVSVYYEGPEGEQGWKSVTVDY